MTPSPANKQIARAAGTVMIAIIVGQVIGLLRGTLVAGAFGASPELDAFLAANRVSETLFLLVAGGALGSAFIPTFTGFLATGDRDSAWKLASSLARLVTLTLSGLALLAAFLAPQIVRYALAPGFASDPALFSLTVTLLRIQLISAILFGLGGLIVGVLNAHQIFLVPALTPAMYQLGIIFGAIFLAPSMGIYGLAWGVVIGAALYLLIQFPSLLKLVRAYPGSSAHVDTYTGTQVEGGASSLNTDHRSVNTGYWSLNTEFWSLITGNWKLDSNTRHVLLLMLPRLIGVAVVQVNFWVNAALASGMEEGSLTGLYYGFSLMLMAQAAIAQSVAIAAMPTFSAQHALGQMDELRGSLAASLRGVILFALPASIGLILLRQPLISALYQRGEFNERDVQLVAWSLLWYAAGLVGHSIMEVLTRAFYAQHDTKTPVVIGTVAMLLNVVLSFAFSSLFAQVGWIALGGLALANSFATALEATALFIVMRKRLGGIEGAHIGRGAAQAALAALGMSLALGAWSQLGDGMSRFVVALGGVAVGGVVYGVALVALRVPEVQSVIGIVVRRLKR